jgi:hypothetical protein
MELSMGSETLKKEFEKRGIFSARDYARKYNRPGIGTVERYIEGSQSPITSTGNWRSAPLRIAQQLGVDVEVLFPEAAEERQHILDDQSNQDATPGVSMDLFHTVRCPKTAEEGAKPVFVLVDLTCTTCPFKVELTGNKLVCGHPKAKDM